MIKRCGKCAECTRETDGYMNYGCERQLEWLDWYTVANASLRGPEAHVRAAACRILAREE